MIIIVDGYTYEVAGQDVEPCTAQTLQVSWATLWRGWHIAKGRLAKQDNVRWPSRIISGLGQGIAGTLLRPMRQVWVTVMYTWKYDWIHVSVPPRHGLPQNEVPNSWLFVGICPYLRMRCLGSAPKGVFGICLLRMGGCFEGSCAVRDEQNCFYVSKWEDVQ